MPKTDRGEGGHSVLSQLHLASDPKISFEVILVALVCSAAGITLFIHESQKVDTKI